MKTKKSESFETVTRTLFRLTRPELQEVAAMVAGLLDATEEQEPDAQAEDAAEKPAARGHIEAKTINGYGPYLYLRYWSGKTLKSQYIGKKDG